MLCSYVGVRVAWGEIYRAAKVAAKEGERPVPDAMSCILPSGVTMDRCSPLGLKEPMTPSRATPARFLGAECALKGFRSVGWRGWVEVRDGWSRDRTSDMVTCNNTHTVKGASI